MQEFISLKENDPSKIYTLLHKISSANNQNDLYKVKNKKRNIRRFHKKIKTRKGFGIA